jgi:hypothetical protein
VLVESLYSWTEFQILKRHFGERLHTIAIHASPTALLETLWHHIRVAHRATDRQAPSNGAETQASLQETLVADQERETQP